jgi:hypothetical protein
MASKTLEDLQKKAAVVYDPAFFDPAPSVGGALVPGK